jgi:pimeloyl-ACP methyl ester carboxylesterase
MTNYLLLHGASSTGWIWHRVEDGLRAHGHAAVAPDFPCADPTATLDTYVKVAVAAAEAFGDEPIVVAAQSLAGLVAPVVATLRPVERLVLVAAMIPRPGESSFDWARETGQREAQLAYLTKHGLPTDDLFDPEVMFVHDFDLALKAESARHVPDQQLGPMQDPVPITRWPDVPTRVVAAADDRFFPLEHMRRQSLDRLGIEPDTIPGGHLALLSQAPALVERLLSYESS